MNRSRVLRGGSGPLGREGKLFSFTDEVAANCARKLARSDSDRCGAICPDLPPVLSLSERFNGLQLNVA